jgi:Protein of unknown function (DUF1566)/PEP-CTERM motif
VKMQFKRLERAMVGALTAVPILRSGAAQAALQDRDVDGNGATDAFYDTDLDITWLRNANVNGLMNWDTAVAWAAGYSLDVDSDWRLPTRDGCFRCSSERVHLRSVELGNPIGSLPNTGGFQNLQSSVYWSGTEYSDPSLAWGTNMLGEGEGLYGYKLTPAYAMAVRNGDVLAMPEPETYALMLAGLASLALARRLRRA